MNIALVGNPNSGKTTLFNLLTGLKQKTGNWPGVTIERKIGTLKKSTFQINDLPGIYSLNSFSPDELVARNYLLNQELDLIINIIDATSLERSLYLTTQLLEMQKPLILVVNMLDVARKQSIDLDLDKLSANLGIKIFGISALKNEGIDDLQSFLQAGNYQNHNQAITYSPDIESILTQITQITQQNNRFAVTKIFENDSQFLPNDDNQIKQINNLQTEIQVKMNEDLETILVNERYSFIENLLKITLVPHKLNHKTLTDKIDEIVTNKYFAFPIFIFVMWAVYYLSIQTIGTIGTDYLNDVVFGEIVPQNVEAWLDAAEVADWMKSLILDGIIAGVGAVIGFIPQIFVLFFCLGILDDCGYMARIAFVMDRIFRKFGLSGKSFIPVLISTGCGIPGIMSSRIIENKKERLITIMTTTFIPCSAKLPVIALIAGAFFPDNSYIAPSAYFLGMLVIVLSAMFLKKLKFFSSESSFFIMELPRYHLPLFKNVLFYAFERSKAFLYKAGTIIFLMSVLIWFLSAFNFSFEMVEVEESILAQFGRLFAFIFAPLGWGNWQAAVASLTGLVAKETIISTFGILFHAGEVAEDGEEIWSNIGTIFNPFSGYSFLVFNLLCAPCIAAIGAIKREVIENKYLTMAILYQTLTAYFVALIIYHFSLLIFAQVFSLWTVVAFVITIAVIWFLCQKEPDNLIIAKG
jgi:ferrous iron transport protein B